MTLVRMQSAAGGQRSGGRKYRDDRILLSLIILESFRPAPRRAFFCLYPKNIVFFLVNDRISIVFVGVLTGSAIQR